MNYFVSHDCWGSTDTYADMWALYSRSHAIPELYTLLVQICRLVFVGVGKLDDLIPYT